MATLQRPSSCTKCLSLKMHHEKGPERWVCNDCDFIIVTRKPKVVSGICRDCGAKKGDAGVVFSSHANICQKCRKKYNEQYREANRDRLNEYHRKTYQRDIVKRKAAVKGSNSRSPEAWIMNLRRMLGRGSQKFKVGNGHSAAILDVQVDFDYLWQVFEDQGKLCAITRLEMVHKPGSLRSMSIDRKDSTLGYIPGNVQIICQGVNLLKNKRSQDETLEFFDECYKQRRWDKLVREREWHPNPDAPNVLNGLGGAMADRLIGPRWHIALEKIYANGWALYVSFLEEVPTRQCCEYNNSDEWFDIAVDGESVFVTLGKEEGDMSDIDQFHLSDPQLADKIAVFIESAADEYLQVGDTYAS